jgi:hypothetical protein
VLPAPQAEGITDLGAFLGWPPPVLGADEAGMKVDATTSLERTTPAAATARIDAWGPKNGDWDRLGRWKVYWLGPFGGWPEVRSSATTQAPWPSLDLARRALTPNAGTVNQWVLAGGDDADHALLVGRHLSSNATAELIVLEADRAPVDVRRPGGEPLPEVIAATRVGGRWYVATAQPAGDLGATVVWLLDGSQAREIARLPRTMGDARTTLRLARRADGRALGVVVDGQGEGERGPAVRWVSSVDLETGAVGEPTALAPVDLADRSVALCTGDDGGWQVDVPYPGHVTLHAGARETSLEYSLARLRLSSRRACLERMAGSVPSLPQDVAWFPPRPLVRAGDVRGVAGSTKMDVRTVDVGITSSQMRYELRCTAR